jgi:two-component system chemotaxis response regulator CheY
MNRVVGNDSSNTTQIFRLQGFFMIANLSIKILIVDDDEDFLEVVANDVERILGIRPNLAANAKEALEHIQNHSTHFLITDTNMPEMNGVDLLIKAKDHSPSLKVIMLFSGLNGSNIDAKEILRLGAYMVLSKAEVRSRLYPFLRAYAIGQAIWHYMNMIFPTDKFRG